MSKCALSSPTPIAHYNCGLQFAYNPYPALYCPDKQYELIPLLEASLFDSRFREGFPGSELWKFLADHSLP